MSIFKVVSGEDSILLLYDRINYVKRPTATTADFIYGASVSTIYTYEEMKRVKEFWRQEEGKAFYHLILSPEFFEETEAENFFVANAEIAEWLGKYDGWRQVIMAVHFDKKSFLHSHFIVNNVNISDGSRWHLSPFVLREVKREISKILLRYGISEIRQRF